MVFAEDRKSSFVDIPSKGKGAKGCLIVNRLFKRKIENFGANLLRNFRYLDTPSRS